jgi:hypothetical protein
MSTISTHLNWGSSYIVDDCYKRFWAPDRSDAHYILVARLSTVVLVILAAVVALWLDNARQAFQILLQIGAGTGLIFLLRWYWWRINAWGEVAAMVISFLVAVYFEFIHFRTGLAELGTEVKLVAGVIITTVGWMTVNFLTPKTDAETLRSFYREIHPIGPGWRPVVEKMQLERSAEAGDVSIDDAEATSGESLTAGFLAWFLGCVTVYAALFGTGYLLYGELVPGVFCVFLFAGSATWLSRVLPHLGFAD